MAAPGGRVTLRSAIACCHTGCWTNLHLTVVYLMYSFMSVLYYIHSVCLFALHAYITCLCLCLWPLPSCCRFQARVVLRNCSLVLPGQRFIDRLVYWANAFNSDLDFWRQQTQYMRNKLLYTAMSVSAAGVLVSAT